MKKRLFSLLCLVMVASMLLAACQPAATPPAQESMATEAEVEATEPEVVEEPTEEEVEATEAPEQEATATEAEGAAEPSGDLMKVEAESCDYGGEFKSIEAVDERTVKFTLCFPDPAFPSKVAFNVFSIADTADIEALGGDSLQMSDNANGTGPFMLDSWTRGDNITYTANPNYWGGAPAYDTLIFKWSTESAQRLLELQSGQADGIDNPAPEDFATIEGDANLALYPRDALNIFYIGFNVDIPPFDNELVRQAFAKAIDRERIVAEYYPEGSRVADVFVPPALQPGYSEGMTWYEYDPEGAQALLEEAGWDSSTEVKLAFRNVVRGYLPTPDKVAQEIQAQLAEVGINVRIEEQESTTFIDNTAAGLEGFFLLGWGADYPDATNFYDYHFANDNNKQFGTLFEDIVEPIRQAGQVADPAERQALYDTVNELLMQHVPVIPVAHGASAVAFQAGVENAMTGPLANEPFYLMNPGKDTLVWVQNGEPAALWCSDETDGESLRACQQLYEPLLNFEPGGVEVVPWLAEDYSVNDDVTEYTFTLREGVTFHNGETLDANDVVASYKMQWDASDPAHTGRTTTFEYFGAFFGAFLNAPPSE